jgi:integrase
VRDTLSKALRSMGYQGQATPHGFRAMASTMLNEMGFRPDVIERQLAHKEPNKIRAAYNRAQYLTERAKMMQHWADFLGGLAKGGKVIAFKKSAA